MSAIIFYLVALPFFYLLSVLPFPLLYLFSDFVCFVLFGLVGYRKDVVTQNMKNSFPEKSDAEIAAMRKRFFHYFCDLFLEVFKTLTISKKNAIKHCTFDEQTMAILEKYARENKSMILAMGHMGNWEWGGNTFGSLSKHQLYVVYHPLTNKHFDKLMYDMRTRFGTKLITMKNTYKEVLGGRDELGTYAFIADQTPRPENAYWTTFLHQETPFYRGMENISRKLNYPVIYAKVYKLKRGYYEVRSEVLCEEPGATKENELTEMFARQLEKDIKENPEIWLWTHRRWKYMRPEGMPLGLGR